MLDTILSMFGWESDDSSRSSTKNVYAPTVINVNNGTRKKKSKEKPKEEPKEEPPKKWSIYPCPFCGGNVLTFSRQSIAVGGRHDGQHWVVFCEKCGAKGPLSPTKDEAAEMWNKPSLAYNKIVKWGNDLEKERDELKKSSPESILEELKKNDDLFKSIEWTTTALPKVKRKKSSCIGAGRKKKLK